MASSAAVRWTSARFPPSERAKESAALPLGALVQPFAPRAPEEGAAATTRGGDPGPSLAGEVARCSDCFA